MSEAANRIPDPETKEYSQPAAGIKPVLENTEENSRKETEGLDGSRRKSISELIRLQIPENADVYFLDRGFTVEEQILPEG